MQQPRRVRMGVQALVNSRASVLAWTPNLEVTSATRQPLGVAFGGSGDQGVGHFSGDAASGHALPIELSDDRGPMDAVPPSEHKEWPLN
jgi:hypothetical protein